MYRFHYRNKKSGANVFSHNPLEREELELVREMPVLQTITASMKQDERVVKPIVYKTPKVTKTKRKKK